jgi:hypothetical protein
LLLAAASAGGVVLAGAGSSAQAYAVSPASALTFRLSRLLRKGAAESEHALSVAAGRRGLAVVKAHVRTSQYGLLAQRLPALIAAAEHGRADGPELIADAMDSVLAGLYCVAAEAMTKFGEPGLAATALARASVYAERSDDVLAGADVAQMRCILARKAGASTEAREHVVAAADRLAAASSSGQLAVYGGLLCTAAYTAARAGDRQGSRDLLDAAAAAAGRLSSDDYRPEPAFGFNAVNVTFYRIGVADALGDPGEAIRLARAVRLDTVRVPERRARFWLDVARAFEHLGRRQECLQALQRAEWAAPVEVRARAATCDMVRQLLDGGGRVDSVALRALAARVGVRW